MGLFRKEKCDCCRCRERTQIAIMEDDEQISFCDECTQFIDEFLNGYTGTKWIEVVKQNVNLKKLLRR